MERNVSLSQDNTKLRGIVSNLENECSTLKTDLQKSQRDLVTLQAEHAKSKAESEVLMEERDQAMKEARLIATKSVSQQVKLEVTRLGMKDTEELREANQQWLVRTEELSAKIRYLEKRLSEMRNANEA